MSDPTAPASTPIAGRGWTILLVSLVVGACVLALIATALYLTGTFVTGPPILLDPLP